MIIREILDTEKTPSNEVLEKLKEDKEKGVYKSVYIGGLAIKSGKF